MVPPVSGISVLMPAFNVGEVIAEHAARVAKAMIDYPNLEIVICDDGSTDGTGRAATDAAADLEVVRVVRHERNLGKGAALRTAFNASTKPTVVFLDGDLDLPPEQLPAFLTTFADRSVDALVGEKSVAMSESSFPTVRRVLSRIYSGVVALLFRLPVRETQTGLKVFRREAIEDVLPDLTINRFTFDIELLARLVRRGATIEGTPVDLAPTAAATGLSIGTLFEMARDTLLTWWRLRRPRS